METTLLLHNAIDIGEALLMNGGEVYRVEDSIQRLLKAYGASRVDVFTIPSLIVVTVQMPGEEPVTQTRRILHTSTNFHALTCLNALCRKTCREKPDPETIGPMLAEILSQRPYPACVIFLVYMVTSFAFASFFGGSWADAAASAVGGGLLFLVMRVLEGHGISMVFTHLGGAAAAAASALITVRLGLGAHLDKIIIGNIMLLIPGIELTNGMRDLFSGDILAGLLHIGEAVFLATVIALGAAYILSLGGAA